MLAPHRGAFRPRHPPVAILTGHGGRCWPRLADRPGVGRHGCDPHRPRGAGAGLAERLHDMAAEVAILTGHGGPVLAHVFPSFGLNALKLRSSPATGGRCWRVAVCSFGHTNSGCDPHRPRGPVLVAGGKSITAQAKELRSSPATGAGAGIRSGITTPSALESCDPHRPRGAGAGTLSGSTCSAAVRGCDPHRPRGAGAGTSSTSPAAPCPGCCDPHRPPGAGAGPWPRGWARQAPERLRSSPATGGRCWREVPPAVPIAPHALRSSPATGGRCWLAARGSADPGPCRGCDPHRPRGAGAGRRRP